MKTNKKGFTLIELLVVVAIVSLLSSVVLVSLKSARQKAYDTRRVEDMKEIQKAIQMYFSDNGSYPPFSQTCNAGADTGWPTAFKNALVPKYIPVLPEDPQHQKAICQSGVGWNYYYGFTPNITWTWGTGCIANVTGAVLYSSGAVGGNAGKVDDCKLGAPWNTIRIH